jgi:hypothetical protein
MEAHFYHYNTKYGSVINAKQFQDGLFVIGLVLGVCALVTRRLGMSVVAHCAFNATGLIWVATR